MLTNSTTAYQLANQERKELLFSYVQQELPALISSTLVTLHDTASSTVGSKTPAPVCALFRWSPMFQMRTVSDLMVVDRLRFPRLHRNLRTTAFTNNKKPLPSPQQPLEKTVTVKKQCGPEYSTDQNRILLYILSSTIVLLSTYLTLFSSLSSVAIYVILSLATVFYGRVSNTQRRGCKNYC